jgi:hypothetical protein
MARLVGGANGNGHGLDDNGGLGADGVALLDEMDDLEDIMDVEDDGDEDLGPEEDLA